MQTEIPSLWSTEAVRVDVLSPAAILRKQAADLSRLSQGVLRGDVRRVEKENAVELHFDVIAPAAGDIRRRIATVVHEKNGAYPATLRELQFVNGFEEGAGTANSQREFVKMLSDWLNSGTIISVIHSLIAISNDEPTAETAANVSS